MLSIAKIEIDTALIDEIWCLLGCFHTQIRLVVLQLFVGTHLGNLVEALEEELLYCWQCDALERQAK